MVKFNASKANPNPMQKQFADNYEEKRRMMFLYTARELTGRAMQREYIAKEKSLDWTKFNQHFDSYYEDYNADEILKEILSNVYWLSTEAEVIELYFRYQEDARKNSNSSKQKSENNFEFTK